MRTEVRRILIVDDSPEDCSRAKRLLTQAMDWDWQFAEARSGEQGLAQALNGAPCDCILIDYHLPDMDGTEFLALLRAALGDPSMATVMITGAGSESIAVRALKSGAQEYISKSNLKSELLFRTVESAISHFQQSLAQRRSAEALIESEKHYRALADAMPQIVWTARPDGRKDYFNRQWYALTGFPSDQAADRGWTQTLHPDDVEASQGSWWAAVSSGGAYEIQSRLLDRNSGLYRWYLVRALAERDDQGAISQWVGTATDIDDHKRLNEELEQRVDERTAELSRSLVEKTTLLKEVHHRVKNNLQVICSLLSMQISCAESDLYAEPLKDAHSRVLAMSLIHEQIYQAENLADLNFGDYIKQLSGRLFEAYCIDPSRIKLEVSVDMIHFDVDQAVPCGLILNELLSNSLKHGFRDGREGAIRISLKRTGGGMVTLEVSDNGVGLPSGFRVEDSPSLGLQVVRTLSKQLRAELAVSGEGGTTFSLSLQVIEKAGDALGVGLAAP